MKLHILLLVLFINSALLCYSQTDAIYIKSDGNVGIGASNTANVKLDVAGAFAYREGALTLVNGANDNIALTGDMSFYQITGPSAAFSISGFAGGVNGRMLTLVNNTSQIMTIVNLSTSAAANQIRTLNGANIVSLATQSAITFQYSSADSKWQVTATRNFSDMNVPSGMISMWSGTLAAIPTGWLLCDGGSGTPDLRDKFILSVAAAENPGATGGAHSYSLTTGQLPAHNHTASSGNAGAFTPAGSISFNGGFTPAGTLSSDGGFTPAGTIGNSGGFTPAGTLSSDGGFTPAGTIGNAGSHTHNYGGHWTNDNSTLISGVYGDGGGNTYTDGVGYWGTGTTTSGATDLTHQHQWGGVWNNDNSNAIAYPEGDGGGNTYSDGNLGINYWSTGSVTSGYTNVDHAHQWGNAWNNDDSRYDGYLISDGWAWWDAGWSNFSGTWTGSHAHTIQTRGWTSGWGQSYAAGGGGWASYGSLSSNGTQLIKHRHFLQARQTSNYNSGNAQNHAHQVPTHRHYIKPRQTSNQNTGNNMNHTHTVPNHRHWIQVRTSTAAADHNHTFTGTAVAAHSHTFTGTAVAAHNHTFAGTAVAAHSHTFTGTAVAAHNHTFTGTAVADHSHTITVNNTGSGTAIDNRPAFYKLAFIMKQ